jgi:hypothetical protein
MIAFLAYSYLLIDKIFCDWTWISLSSWSILAVDAYSYACSIYYLSSADYSCCFRYAANSYKVLLLLSRIYVRSAYKMPIRLSFCDIFTNYLFTFYNFYAYNYLIVC